MNDQPKKRRVIWHDLWYAADLWQNLFSDGKPYAMEFELHEIKSMSADMDESEAQEGDYDAEKTAHGSIKWDGCINYDFVSDNCMRHECGRAGIERLGKALLRLYDEAEALFGTKMP